MSGNHCIGQALPWVYDHCLNYWVLAAGNILQNIFKGKLQAKETMTIAAPSYQQKYVIPLIARAHANQFLFNDQQWYRENKKQVEVSPDATKAGMHIDSIVCTPGKLTLWTHTERSAVTNITSMQKIASIASNFMSSHPRHSNFSCHVY